MDVLNKLYKVLYPYKKYFIASLLFFALLILNNCGGGGGGSNNASVLDLMSANDIEVTTVNDQNGIILGNVFVGIAEVGNEQVILKSASTGDSGIYVFSKMKIGSYKITASRSGFETNSANVIVTNGPQKITVRLVPSFPPDSISGVIKRSDDLTGIPDVNVEIKDSSPIIKAITDKTGAYTLNSVQPTSTGVAPYVIKATKVGFKSEERANVVKLPNIALKNIDITMIASSSTEVQLPGKVIGIVRDKNKGTPLENINVTIQDSGLTADFSRNTGYYRIENVPAGKTYIMTAIETTTIKKYKPYSLAITLTSEQTLNQDILMDPVDAEVIPDTSWIIGTVMDSVANSALAGATVELLGTSFYDITKANGSFKISNLTPQTEYIILYSKSGYTSQTQKKKVEKNENNLDSVLLVPNSSSQNYCSIIGVVRDADTKITVPGINVEISVPDTQSINFVKYPTTTSSGGEFAFTNIYIPNDKIASGQNITMTISRSDYVSKTIQINIKGGLVNQVDEARTEVTKLKGTIMGAVVDADTRLPISGASVSIANFTYPQITNPTTTAASTGTFQFADIPVGTYNLLITAPNYATEVKNGITLTYNGQTIGPLSIQLKHDYGTITGYVYLETNGFQGFQTGTGGDTPLSGMSISASQAGSSSGAITTDISKSDGSYMLNNLPLSSVVITANSGTGANANYSSYSTNYTVAKGYQNLNIELANTKGNISGIIYEDSNKNGQYDNEPLISGAAIAVAQGSSTLNTVSDAQGNYIITGLGFGTVTLTVTKSNYNSASKTATLPQNSNLNNVYIGLSKPTGKIAGRVIDAVNNQGIPDVTIKVLGFTDLTTKSDSTGGYIFNNVLAKSGGVNQYTIVADGSSYGYNVNTTPSDAPEEGAVINIASISLTRNNRLVYGKVIDSVTKAGIQDIRVQIAGTAFTATTNSSGDYVFDAVPVNLTSSYTINFTDATAGTARYQSNETSVSVNNDTAPLKVQNIEMSPNLGKIKGVIYDSVTGVPIKSSLFVDPIVASVTIPGVATPVTTNVSPNDGSFTLNDLPKSVPLTVRIFHNNAGTNPKYFEEVTRDTTVTAGQTTDLGIIYVSLKTVTIKGYVRDEIDQTYGVPNAVVTASIDGVSTFSRTATTNSYGYYQLTVPYYSGYKFRATASNYNDYEETSSSVGIAPPGFSYHGQTILINPQTGNLKGTVYLDTNGDGSYNAGETKIREASSGTYVDGDFRVTTKYRNITFDVPIDPDSTFTISNVPVGQYYLTVTPPTVSAGTQYQFLHKTSWYDSATNQRIITVQATGNSPATINTVVTKTDLATSTGSISGTIVDAETLLPLSGVTIDCTAKNVHATTDSSGYFSMTNLNYYTSADDSTENYTLDYRKSGYITLTQSYEMSNFTEGSREIQVYEYVSRGKGIITGSVTDSSTHQPLTAVTITIVGLNTPAQTSDANGSFTFIDIPTGAYDINFRLNDYASYTYSGLSVAENSKTYTVSATMSRNYSSISGILYLESNGTTGYQLGQDKPLSDITVTATGPAEGGSGATSSISQSDGSYAFNNLRFGTYTLTFTTTAAEQYNASPVLINISSTTPVARNVEMKAKTGTLYGVVFDDLNGNGVKDGSESTITGITVTPATAFGAFTAFTTGSGGDYRFANMNPIYGSLTLQNGTNTRSYQSKTIYQTVVSGTETRLDIPMTRNTVSIYGRAVDSGTSIGVAGVNVSINGTSYATVTGSDGRFTFDNVTFNNGGSTYNVYFDAFTLGYQYNTVTTPSTSGANITMTDTSLTKSSRKITGKVVNSADLTGVQNATVTKKDDSTVTATTDAYGNFTINTVEVDLVNPIELVVTASDYENQLVSFNLGVGTTIYKINPDIQITSSLGKVTGKVIDTLTNGPVYSPNFGITAGITEGNVSKSVTVANDGTFTLSGVPKSSTPYSLVIQCNAGSNQNFNDVINSVSVSAGQTTNLGTIYITLKPLRVTGTVYDQKIYTAASNANDLGRAGISDATITAQYTKYDGSVFSSSVNSTTTGSFEIYLPALRYNFTISKTNFNSQTVYNKNLNTYPNDFTNLDFQLKPQSYPVEGSIYFDSNTNGVADAGEPLIFTAQGGIYSSLSSSLNVSYSYRGFTFGASVMNNSTFTIPDVPVGKAVFTAYDSANTGKIIANSWVNPSNPVDREVTINTNSTSPSLVNIAVAPSTSQYAQFNGTVYDYKIYKEGFKLYGLSANDLSNVNAYVPNVTIRITNQNGYSKTVTTTASGQYFFMVPGGQRYDIAYSAVGYDDSSETLVQADTGASYGREIVMVPKSGTISGKIYYDNNTNGNNWEATDYNHIHEASEREVNQITGHPMPKSDWSGVTFNVSYSYRGMTFGTTTFDKGNSTFTIERVPANIDGSPAGTAGYTLLARDVSSLSNWPGVGADYDDRMFMDQRYTIDGKNPSRVIVNTNQTVSDINFAVMVWGGHVNGRRILSSGGTTPDYSTGMFDKRTTTFTTPIRGSDYWTALGGSLNQINNLNIQRKYYLDFVELGYRLPFTDALGVIDIKSYPEGNNPDIIIPPGTYTLNIAGDIDLSSDPQASNPPNDDAAYMAWHKSSTGFYFKYGPANMVMGIPTPPHDEKLASDRCLNTVNQYRGGTSAAPGSGLQVKAGEAALVQ